jgi:hypothetical protein
MFLLTKAPLQLEELELGIEVMYLNIIMAIYNKSIDRILLNGEK